MMRKKHYQRIFWGRSSAGRAPALHAGGQEFDPPRLHQQFGWMYEERLI